MPTTDDITDAISAHTAQSERSETRRDPGTALAFFTGWRRDLGDGDLHVQDAVIAGSKTRTRSLQSDVNAGGGGSSRAHSSIELLRLIIQGQAKGVGDRGQGIASLGTPLVAKASPYPLSPIP